MSAKDRIMVDNSGEIMVVDDTLENLRLLTDMLSSEGIRSARHRNRVWHLIQRLPRPLICSCLMSRCRALTDMNSAGC
ncbi:hypothetical protein VT98_13442 [Candidatus Electrothrix communis]|uniref:Uncharacterized protein n=1 Tax=Candidatus Electrothrix communis TaxID=1859133 RepID=A0A444IWL4_9BACT|nr:hypothetical protein VT98_13442 [Candidatus Electrothrix communis]